MSKLPFESIKRKIIVKKEAETNPAYGTLPKKRSVEELIRSGVLVIDKPQGPTSHQVADYVKKILNLKKAGHSGTLDPNVTGVLPVALEDSTKIVQVLLPAGKEYIALAHFHKEVTEDQIKKSLDNHIGKIMQLPPVRSAVKRQLRQRRVYYIDILEINGKDVLFRMGCQAGTYVRKLIHDAGRKLGGAHMAELRRTKAGPFNETDLITLQDLSDALYYYTEEGNDKYIRHCIKPVESAIYHLPKISVLDTTVDTLCHGADLAIPGISLIDSGINQGDIIAITSLKGELIALGKARLSSEEMISKNKGSAVKTFRVFMEPGTYPAIKKSVNSK